MSSYIGVPGRSYCQVQMGDLILPLHSLSFGSLLVSEHTLYRVPMAELTFVDSISLCPKVVLIQDGMPVRIVLGVTPEMAKTYHFRVYNVVQKDLPNGKSFRISMVSDLDLWRLPPYRKHISGTSAAVMRQLASECNFNSTLIDDTNDKQTWLAGNRTPADFAGYVAQRGYVNEESCMLLGVTAQKQLRYVNLAALDFQRALPHFTKNSQEGMVITSFQLSSKSGVLNQAGGYNTVSSQFKPDVGAYETHTKVRARRLGGAVDMNSNVKQSAGLGRFRTLPLDSGNNHEFYSRALHQNNRLQQLLSHGAVMLCPQQTSVTLFDPVLCSIYTMDKFSVDLKPDPAVSGLWIVAGKTSYLSGSLVFAEKIHLMRNGYGIDTARQAGG